MSEITIVCTCGAPMVERLNTVNASSFLGCSRFPECRETQKVPACIEVVRSGGIPLPGFDSVPAAAPKRTRGWEA